MDSKLQPLVCMETDFFFEIKFEKFKIRNNKTFKDIIVIEGNGTGSY
jgi:hypothetical protein